MQRRPQTVWFTMIERGGEWVRVGPRYHRKITAVSWLPFVAGLTRCRAKATPCKLRFDADGDLTAETKRILDEQFNAEGHVLKTLRGET